MVSRRAPGGRASGQRSNHRLRGEGSEYRHELAKSVLSSLNRKGIEKAASTWTRWTQDSEFPSNGDAETRLLFAIKKHCKTKRTKVFFIGCRDAAVVAGVKSTRTSAKLLHDLQRRNILSSCTADGWPCRDGPTGAMHNGTVFWAKFAKTPIKS